MDEEKQSSLSTLIQLRPQGLSPFFIELPAIMSRPLPAMGRNLRCEAIIQLLERGCNRSRTAVKGCGSVQRGLRRSGA